MRLGTFLTCSTLSFCYANTALRGGGGGRVGDADAGVWLGEEGERGSGTGLLICFEDIVHSWVKTSNTSAYA